jgi:Zn-dependent protease
MLLWVIWGTNGYSSKSWEFAEIVAMFLIVLLHEMGHVVVARGVGRMAREVVLWPLGGVALMEMPNWCADEVLVAAAGPAVNLVLLPVLFGMWYWFGYFRGGNVSQLLWRIAWDNVGILFFNLLPIWPLDGGRVVQGTMAARWGITRSRVAGSLLGLVCAAGGIALAMHMHAYVPVSIFCVLIFLNVMSLQWSFGMLSRERSDGFHASAICPHCGSRALDAPNGRCEACGETCNFLMNGGRCWNCDTPGGSITCSYCDERASAAAWGVESGDESSVQDNSSASRGV